MEKHEIKIIIFGGFIALYLSLQIEYLFMLWVICLWLFQFSQYGSYFLYSYNNNKKLDISNIP